MHRQQSNKHTSDLQWPLGLRPGGQKSNKVADTNELYDFIIPLDLEHYGKARTRLAMLVLEYENARKKFHKKDLGISNDLKREIVTIDTMIGDIKRLTDLIPEFGEEADKYRDKRQLAVIGAGLTGLAGFLLGNVLGNSGGDSDRLDEIEEKYRLFSKSNLDFEEKQIAVNNEFSR